MNIDKEQRDRMIRLLTDAQARISFVAGALMVVDQKHGDALTETLTPIKNALDAVMGS